MKTSKKTVNKYVQYVLMLMSACSTTHPFQPNGVGYGSVK